MFGAPRIENSWIRPWSSIVANYPKIPYHVVACEPTFVCLNLKTHDSGIVAKWASLRDKIH